MDRRPERLILLLTLVFSNHCNMDCSYCCITNKNTSPALPLEKAIAFVESYPKADTIEFFGGEPTLHMDYMAAIMERFPSKSYRLYTNLSFDNHQLETIKRLQFDEIFASLDGKDYQQNKVRFHNSSGEEGFNRAISNLVSLCEFSPYNLSLGMAIYSPLQYASLVENIDYFRSLGVKSFALEVVTTVGDFKQSSFNLDKLLKIADICVYISEEFNKEYHHNNNGLLFSLPRELISSDFYFNVMNGERCSSNSRAISPRGNQYICRDHAANEEGLEAKSKVLKFYKKDSVNSLQVFGEDGSHLESLEDIVPCALKSYAAIEYGYIDKMFWLKEDIQKNVIQPLFMIQDLLYKCLMTIREILFDESQVGVFEVPEYLAGDIKRLSNMTEAYKQMLGLYKNNNIEVVEVCDPGD